MHQNEYTYIFIYRVKVAEGIMKNVPSYVLKKKDKNMPKYV